MSAQTFVCPQKVCSYFHLIIDTQKNCQLSELNNICDKLNLFTMNQHHHRIQFEAYDRKLVPDDE